MASKKASRRYHVDWDESPWEKALWRPHQTFHPVLALIEEVARAHGRQQFMDELVPSPQDIRVSYTVDAQGRLSFGRANTSDRRAVVLTHAIHRVIRELKREDAARILRMVDLPDESGAIRRTIVVRWDRQKLSTSDQINRLQSAVQSGSQYMIEKAWFGLTPRAHEYLSVGYEVARRRGDFDGYKDECEVPATIIPLPMLAPNLLKRIIPYAIRAVARRGRQPVHPRDEALARVLGFFVEVSGRATTAARRGGHNEPIGSGADFVRRIESIFRVALMPEGSTHAVARAKTRMCPAARNMDPRSASNLDPSIA